MSELSLFSFAEKLPVRVAEINNEPWFVARDVASCLEYSKSSLGQISNLVASVPDQWKRVLDFETNGGRQKLLALSEQGLYFFLGRSDKPKALPFQMWLAGEVLPAIRKTGSYSVGTDDLNFNRRLNENEAKIIREEVAERYRQDRTKYRVVYAALREHFGVQKYTFIPANRLEEAILFIRNTDFQRYDWTSAPSANNGGSSVPGSTAPQSPTTTDDEFVAAIGKALIENLPRNSEELLKRLLFTAAIVEIGRKVQNLSFWQKMQGEVADTLNTSAATEIEVAAQDEAEC